MTVKELIENLQEFPHDAEVGLEDETGETWKVMTLEFTGKIVMLVVSGGDFE